MDMQISNWAGAAQQFIITRVVIESQIRVSKVLNQSTAAQH
jgi:hypothetical protein